MAKKKATKAAQPKAQIARPKPTQRGVVPAGYDAVLTDLKTRIRAAQLRAAHSVNQELLLLYFDIGFELHLRTPREAWGSSVIDRLIAEYALRDIHKPIGVAGWETKLVESLPKNLRGSLPTIEELEAELSRKPAPVKPPKRRRRTNA